ncbi:class I ribonucleotide reductase maintenance protein YfaE [Paraferrimonas haliotis]|uniref:(2Fe-2S) ferredoxin n=1 Tax=Paraferrimonas haliotis TaxID=2013866 RepID=A0AA37WVJ6_9GAMM|nr:class I ribonucleotide reductase maintenance protein YfaE [Paraferrimonas haliotis]GLS82653.1 (2Fe-2S) ferredoxin [Paraferrimonas haliotis]
MSWIYLKDKRPIFYVDDSKTLLETLEDNKVDSYSECRNGYCGTCRLKLLNGEVHYPEEPISHVEQDECLPCCCYPKSDIELEID